MVDLDALKDELEAAGFYSCTGFEHLHADGRTLVCGPWIVTETGILLSSHRAELNDSLAALDIIRRHVSPPDQADGELRERIQAAMIESSMVYPPDRTAMCFNLDRAVGAVLAAIGGAVNPAPTEAG